jgi:DNA-binding IclR family transcriptional regulator
VRVIVSIGNHGPIHATATGKAILSRQPTAFLQRLSRSKLSSYTPRTITDFTDLERELEKTRSRGFALAIDEWSIGLAGVAAPILNSAGKAFAAAGITFPTSRFTEEHMLEMGNIVIQTAEEISRRLLQS